MKKYKQLEKLFGRELTGDDLVFLSNTFGRSIESFKDTEAVSIQELDDMPTESMFSNNMMNSDEFEYQWQKLSSSRRSDLRAKLEYRDFSPAYECKAIKLSDLVEKIGATMGNEMIKELYDAIDEQEEVLTHLNYNKGYLDGIKFALMAGQL